MSTITTRTSKGSALSWAEADANFTNLNADKLEVTTLQAATNKTTPDDADTVPIVDSILKKVTWANIKATLKTYFDTLYAAAFTIPTGIVKGNGSAFSVATAGTDYVAPGTGTTFTAVQKTTVTTDNDLTINCATVLDVTCTPTAGGTLTFSNIAAGQKFEILFVNTSNYAITKGSNIKCSTTLFTTISATGRYVLAARCLDGTNIDLTCSGALS